MLPPIIFAALCLFALLAAASIRRIPEGHVYTLRRMGGHVRVVGSGTHLIVPWVERVAQKINLAGAVVSVDRLADGDLHERATVYFQILDPQRAEVVIADVELRLQESARRLYTDAPPAETREARRQWLKQALNAEMREHGLLIARVDLRPAD